MKIQHKPLVERFSGNYWKSEITKAEERSKKFIELAEESIRVYNAQKQVGVLNDAERRINSWWYCVNTLLPAYYSSTPKAEVTLRKRTGGVVEELAATILERNIQYRMDNEFPFDYVGYNSALQFLLTGRAVLWARYGVEIEKELVEMACFQAPDGQLIDQNGQAVTQEIKEQRQGPGSIILVTVEIERKDDEEAVLDIVQYNDYYCSDARNETEVEWRCKRAYLTREQAERLFDNDGVAISQELTYDSFPDQDKKDWNKDHSRYEGKAEVYEIWCEETEKVYWGHKNHEKFIFHTSEPPIEFEGFYPCSIIAQSVDPDSVIPVSDYAHVKDQVLEIERLTTRIHAVTQAIRTNFLYDAALGDQVEQLLNGDLKGTPVINWPSYKSRGGVSNGVEFMDIAPYVNALQILQGARETALQQLYETLKVSDLLRGTSQQYKSATANRLESQWSSLGLVVRQNMFCKFISDSISNLGTIIASQFEAEEVLDVGDADNLIYPILPPPPEPPPAPPIPEGMDPSMMPPPPPMPQYDPMAEVENIKMQIMEVLRDEDKRCYRIRIASDSMIAIDQAQDQQEGQVLMQTAGEYFNAMKGLIEQYPPLMDFSISLFQNMIKRFKGSKELDGLFSKALAQIGDIAKAKEEAAKQPPPPDPVMQEMQARMQIAQVESQARIQATQIQVQDAHEKNMLAYQEQQMKMARDQFEMQLAAQKQQFDEYIKQQQLVIEQQIAQAKQGGVQVDLLKVQSQAENESAKHAITQETNRMSQILEIQKLELEQMRVRLSESEKLMEERRLASEQQLERLRTTMEAAKVGATQSQQPIVINNVIPKQGKKVGKVTLDELGNPSIEIANVDEGQ